MNYNMRSNSAFSKSSTALRYKTIDDSSLVNLYKEGDEKAFEELVHRHKSKIYTAILLIVKDNSLAEDLMQETFIKAINTIRAGRYNEQGKFLPWIVRIAHNLAIDFFRRDKRYPTTELDDNGQILNTLGFSEDSAETAQIRKETYTRLRVLIQQLPDKQREVLIMRHYAEMTFQEIAEATGVSVNTALGRMRYALINLRKNMTKSNTDYDQALFSA
jgi:RNA polymerase sigma-70 factor (ECF subfamily)